MSFLQVFGPVTDISLVSMMSRWYLLGAKKKSKVRGARCQGWIFRKHKWVSLDSGHSPFAYRQLICRLVRNLTPTG